MTIKLFDSLTNTKVNIEEIFDKEDLKIYGCGVTVYDHCHIGHGRVFVFFDALLRALKEFGFKVRAARNITDIDDKIIKKALESDTTCQEVTTFYTNSMHEDIKSLNCQDITYEPKATENIKSIVDMIKKLVEKNHAYVADDGEVLFDIASFKKYGQLSSQDLQQLKHGIRVDTDSKKKNPGDFTLWKPSKVNEPYWPSPWGNGRPGWHIECSAMIENIFRSSIDIHLGGADLKFPHHENEIAQSECCHERPLSKIWLHIGFVQVKNEKMSKSLGNFVTLKELMKKYCPNTVRLFYLMTHYRQPLAFSDDILQTAQNTYSKLKKELSFLNEHQGLSDKHISANSLNLEQYLFDDLNFPELFANIFKQIKALKVLESQEKLEKGYELKAFLERVLGLYFDYSTTVDATVPENIRLLAEARWVEKKNKNWEQADLYREKVESLGWEILDNQSGYEIKKV